MKISLIHRRKAAGAFHSPNGLTRYSYVPNLVKNAVLYSSPSLIQMLLYVSLMSSLVEYLAPTNLSIVSLIRGSGCRSFLVISLSAR